MRYSDNYNLKLPQRGVDRANVDDLDDNFETIDGALADDRQISLPMYDSTQSYNTGDIRGYENPTTHRIRAYRCLEDNVTGPWDATKWAQTTLADEIEQGGGGTDVEANPSGSATADLNKLKVDNIIYGIPSATDMTGATSQVAGTHGLVPAPSAGDEGKVLYGDGTWGTPQSGVSELSQLDDVDFTTPTEGQAVTFDETNSKWVNSDLPAVTKTASGNPVEFEDGANAPLVKCVSAIQGSQDLHGYDKPWVGGAGKNKLDPSYRTQTSNAVRFYYGNAQEFQAGTYTFSVSAAATQISVYDSNNIVIGLAYGVNNITVTLGESTLIWVEAYYASATIPSGGLSSINCQFESGSTATAYAPYSNICPITAYTEGEILTRGKNAIDNSSVVVGYIGADGELVVNGSYRSTPFIRIFGNNTYTLSVNRITSGTVGITLNWYDANQDFISKDSNNDGTFGVIYLTAQAPSNARYVRCSFGADTYTTDWQLEDGSTVTPYTPYTSTTHTATFSNSIYQGNADFVGGEAECEKKLLVFDGTEGWTTRSASVGTLYELSVAIEGMGGSEFSIESFTNEYSNDSNLTDNGTFRFLRSTNTVGALSIHDDSIGSLANFKAYLSSHNLQLVYTLMNATTETITPTNLPIKSLFGYNHIESSTGDLDVEYITQQQQPIVDLIESSSGGDSKHHYSTTEQVVGTWIDGSVLYEKTIEVQNFTASIFDSRISTYSGVLDLSTYISSLNHIFPIIEKTYIVLQDTTIRIPLFIDWQSGTDIDISFLYASRTGTLVLTVQYTKTASQSRSAENLSKGGEEPKEEEEVKKVEEPIEEKKEESSESISEPSEEETEDLPTEEEEPEIEGVEEPETNDEEEQEEINER